MKPVPRSLGWPAATFLLLTALSAAAGATECGVQADEAVTGSEPITAVNDDLGRRISLLGGHATIQVPSRASVDPRGYDLMGAAPSDETETRVIIDQGVERLVILVEELLATAGAKVEKELVKATGEAAKKTRNPFVPKRFAMPNLRAYRLTPKHVATDGAANFLAFHYVVLPDGLVVRFTSCLNLDAAQKAERYDELVDAIVRTTQQGERAIDRRAGARALGSMLRVTVPAGYVVTRQAGIDFGVYSILRLADLGAPQASVAVYRSNGTLERASDKKATVVRGKMFGMEVDWLATTLRQGAHDLRRIETIQAVPGKESQVRVRLESEDRNRLRELWAIAESLVVSDDAHPAQAPSPAEAPALAPHSPTKWVTLARTKHNAIGIALDSSHVYFGDMGGTLYKVPKEGGPVVELAQGQGWLDSIAVDATRVYWGGHFCDTIMSVPTAGGPAVEVAKHSNPSVEGQHCSGGVEGLVLGREYVYWANCGAVWRVEKTGGTPTRLVTGQPGATGLRSDAGNLYWINETARAIMTVPISGGKAVQVASLSKGSITRQIAVRGSHVYWIETWEKRNRGILRTASAPGGESTTLATVPEGGTMGIAADDEFVYWTTQEPMSIFKVPVSGGVPTTVALDQPDPLQITVDESGIYWTNQRGDDGVVRLPKRK